MTTPPPPPPPPSAPGQYGPYPQQHPRATLSLVLGIVGIVACQVLGPFAWAIGSKALKEIDASGGAYSGRSEALAGKILGIISTVLLILAAVMLVLFVALIIVLAATGELDDDNTTSVLAGASLLT